MFPAKERRKWHWHCGARRQTEETAIRGAIERTLTSNENKN
jgi:hypothetical protein